MAKSTVTLEEFHALVGTKFEPGPWITIAQDRINTFADCTEDHQFIHIDEEAAKQTPFGGTIAHGFLTLSMLVKMTAHNIETDERLERDEIGGRQWPARHCPCERGHCGPCTTYNSP